MMKKRPVGELELMLQEYGRKRNGAGNRCLVQRRKSVQFSEDRRRPGSVVSGHRAGEYGWNTGGTFYQGRA